MEPELWVKCEKSHWMVRLNGEGSWWCPCHRFKCFSRVPVGVAERMADLYRQVFDNATDCEPWMADLLRAAIGETP